MQPFSLKVVFWSLIRITRASQLMLVMLLKGTSVSNGGGDHSFGGSIPTGGIITWLQQMLLTGWVHVHSTTTHQFLRTVISMETYYAVDGGSADAIVVSHTHGSGNLL